MQGKFKMEYRLFTIVRYNYRDYNTSEYYVLIYSDLEKEILYNIPIQKIAQAVSGQNMIQTRTKWNALLVIINQFTLFFQSTVLDFSPVFEAR